MITGYLVNIRKTYKEFASYTMKILIPYIIMVTSYAFVSTLLPVRDGVNEFTIPIILNTIFVTSIGPYWFLYTMAICGVIYYLTFNLVGKWSIMGKLCLFATFLMLVSQYTPVLNSTNAAFYFTGVCLR
ncbi:acyltransferase family protein, partial [Prevotella sp.]|uniref:acyltransferase family protein n=1 Tax=Prevotella sp. TaxID=59823 RepID=UPI003AF791E7